MSGTAGTVPEVGPPAAHGHDAAVLGWWDTPITTMGLCMSGSHAPFQPSTAHTEGVHVLPMEAAHAAQVLAIYQLGIDSGDATFETAAPNWQGFTAAKLPDHRLVALADDGRVRGWAAVSPVSDRHVYAGVVEVSVYVHPEARGRGVGATLLDALLASTDSAGIWTVQAGIFPENTASLALHHRAGFRTIGTRERIGRQHGRWRDVVLIERRSDAVR